MRRAAYSFARSGCIPESSSLRRSAAAKGRSMIFTFSLEIPYRPRPAPEAPQVAADGLERYPGRRVGDVDRDHADAPLAQRIEQRREPALLQRFEAAAAGVGVRERDRRAQGIEHDEMAPVFRRALEEGFGRRGQRAAQRAREAREPERDGLVGAERMAASARHAS